MFSFGAFLLFYGVLHVSVNRLDCLVLLFFVVIIFISKANKIFNNINNKKKVSIHQTPWLTLQ